MDKLAHGLSLHKVVKQALIAIVVAIDPAFKLNLNHLAVRAKAH